MRRSLIIILFLLSRNAHAFFGTELGPLLQLVSGQVQEIERLAETVGVAKESRDFLIQINEGIDRTISQIRSIETLIERAQGLDPKQVKSLSDLNDLLYRAQQTKAQFDEVMRMKITLTNEVITQSALQSDTAYKMGQEMVLVGGRLAQESTNASPGRAQQITAASASAQMLAQGVQLQTLSQITQLQALTLEYNKSLVERDLNQDRARDLAYQRQLTIAAKVRRQ